MVGSQFILDSRYTSAVESFLSRIGQDRFWVMSESLWDGVRDLHFLTGPMQPTVLHRDLLKTHIRGMQAQWFPAPEIPRIGSLGVLAEYPASWCMQVSEAGIALVDPLDGRRYRWTVSDQIAFAQQMGCVGFRVDGGLIDATALPTFSTFSMAEGLWAPDQVLDHLQLGVRLVYSDHPRICAEQGKAYLGARGVEVHYLDVSASCYRFDERPLVEGCLCPTCLVFSRAYIHHVLQVGEAQAMLLLARHNVHVMRVAVLNQGFRV